MREYQLTGEGMTELLVAAGYERDEAINMTAKMKDSK